MSEFFLELFSEEMPPNLQITARNNLVKNFSEYFEQEKIKYDIKTNIYFFISCVFLIKNLSIIKKVILNLALFKLKFFLRFT